MCVCFALVICIRSNDLHYHYHHHQRLTTEEYRMDWWTDECHEKH